MVDLLKSPPVISVPPPPENFSATWEAIPAPHIEVLNYTYTFPFEDNFEHTTRVQWMSDNWKVYCALAVSLYLSFIVVGRWYMSSRPRYELRTPLILLEHLSRTFQHNRDFQNGSGDCLHYSKIWILSLCLHSFVSLFCFIYV